MNLRKRKSHNFCNLLALKNVTKNKYPTSSGGLYLFIIAYIKKVLLLVKQYQYIILQAVLFRLKCRTLKNKSHRRPTVSCRLSQERLVSMIVARIFAISLKRELYPPLDVLSCRNYFFCPGNEIYSALIQNQGIYQ
jgi:hypothetical protein